MMRTRKFSNLRKAWRALNELLCTIRGQRRDAGSITQPYSTQITQSNEEFALGLRDADTHKPVEVVAVVVLFRHGETQARQIPKYLIKGAVLPEKRVEYNSKSDLIHWLNVRSPPWISGYSGQRCHHLRGHAEAGAGYARIHARMPLPIRFAHVGHPWMQTHFRMWFQVGIPASLKAERYAVAVCMLCNASMGALTKKAMKISMTMSSVSSVGRARARRERAETS